MRISKIIARLVLEGEDPKRMFRSLGKRQFKPRRLTPNEQERLGTILAMGPITKRPGDEKFIEWGWVEHYDDDPNTVVASHDFPDFYHRNQGNLGHIGNEFRDVPYQRRGKVRTYWWPPKMESEMPPLGFTATLPNGDKIEWRYDTAAKGYRFSKWWKDEWTGNQRSAPNLALQHASDASAFIAQEMKRWKDGGWTVSPLE